MQPASPYSYKLTV